MNDDIVLKTKVYIALFISKLYISLKNLFRKTIIINGYLSHSLQGPNPQNFGDDINFPLLEALTGKKVTQLDHHFFHKYRIHMLCIGSIIDDYSTSKSIIWGAGVMNEYSHMSVKPLMVCAVRGKLSKQYLEHHGISCPSIFGDPALLLPYIYDNPVLKEYEIGIIPHVVDYDLPHIQAFRKKHPEIKFIRLDRYKHWQDVIDQIRSCKFIVSSSLHGLIVSDAYKIPNVHALFSNSVKGGEFKFQDYYSGVDRKYEAPLDFTKTIDLGNIFHYFNNYVPIQFDPKPLLQSFPFRLRAGFME